MAVAMGHQPVLVDEVVAASQSAWEQEARGGGGPLVVDCTVGGGGHAEALLAALPGARLFALDRDPRAVAIARQRLAPWRARAQVEQGTFAEVADHLADHGHHRGADFLLADFGVSSGQLDDPARGFSWRAKAGLDMRMGDAGATAADLLEQLDVGQLAALLRRLGQERWARPIAAAIHRHRPTTTTALAQVVAEAVPPGPPARLHPATRTFQALRMAVNNELGQIEALLAALPAVMAPGGGLCLISFHSLEDGLVRDRLADGARGCRCPRALPVCACKGQPLWALSRPKLCRPEAAEVVANPRARSARMRGARRCPAACQAPR